MDTENTTEEASHPMSGPSRVTRSVTKKRWLLLVVITVGVAAIALALLLGRGSSSQEGRPVPAPTGEPVPAPGVQSAGEPQPQPGDITISLSPDKLDSAQLKTEVAVEQAGTVQAAAGAMRTTGIVQSNAYKETPVFPVAGGIVRQVNVELGDRVSRGQSLAVIFSTELADAQGEYLKMLAEEEEHHQHYRRTLELLEIGAVSREELEVVTAKHKTAQANTASARQRLILLGMTPQQIDALKSAGQVRSLVGVPAPVSGTVLSRTVNTGEVVDRGKELFRIADLSAVWVIGQVYESDFAKVSIGSSAAVTAQAYPGRTFTGQVSYIDPRVDPNTRTAQVRIEVKNPREVLRLGMFVDVSFGGAAQASGRRAVAVPRSAVQSIGGKQVVFLATAQPGVFIQREVTAGPEANGLVPTYSGVRAGDRVVTEGSFMLRAESLKLNPAQMTSPASPESVGTRKSTEMNPQQQGADQRADGVQNTTVSVSDKGFQPSTIHLKRAVPARITFVRDVEETCATSVSVPQFNIKRDLPFKEPVVVEFTPHEAGTFEFLCGMNMLKGKIVVK